MSDLLDVLLAFLSRLIDMPRLEGAAAPLEEGRRLDEARCPVCGEKTDSRAVLCSGCLSPHHRDCFLWNGRCAVYACGARRFRPSS